MSKEKNKEENKDERNKENLSNLERGFNRFKDDLNDLRKSFRSEEKNYSKLKEDEEYRYLLDKAEYFEDDTTNDRDYPFRKKFQEAQNRNRKKTFDGDFPELNLSDVGNKVYIKAFHDKNSVEEKIAEIKKQNPAEDAAKLIRDELSKTKKDLEKFIGQDLTLNLGILIFLGAVVILFRYLIHKGMIGYNMRMFSGIAIGVGLYFGAYKMQKKSANIGSILVLIGICVHYYTIYLTLHDYHVLNNSSAFVVCLLVTSVSVLFSVWYDKMELSVIAVLGAYIVPWLVDKTDNYTFFFTYILLVDIGMMAVAYYKKWKFLNNFAYLLTVGFFIIWFFNAEDNTQNAIGSFVFSTAFYVVFFIMSILYTLRKSVKASDQDFKVHILNTVLYFLLGSYILYHHESTSYIGHFAAGIAAFNLMYASILYTHEHMDYEILELFMGFVVFFFAVAVPLYFSFTWTNIIWSSAAVLLFWIAQRFDERVLKDSAVYVMGLALLSMFYVWYSIYFKPHETDLFINKAFVVGAVTSMAMFLTVLMLLKEDYEMKIAFFKVKVYILILGITVLVIGYISGMMELENFSDSQYGSKYLKRVFIVLYTLIFILFLRFFARKTEIPQLKVTSGVIMGVVVLSYTIYGQFSTVELRNQYVDQLAPFWHFGMHYFVLILSVLVVYLLIRDIVVSEGYTTGKYSYVMWLMGVLIVFHASAELDHLMVIFKSELKGIEEAVHNSRRMGYSLLWCFIAICFMYSGIRHRIKELRLIALTLLGITVAKFLILDVWKFSELGKVVAFAFIGLLLMATSLLYKRLEILIAEGKIVYDKDDVKAFEEKKSKLKADKKAKKNKKEESENEDGEEDDEEEEEE